MSLLSLYDTSTPLNPNCLSNTTSSPPQEQCVLWPSLASAIESNIVWDSIYFIRIAQCGYEYVQSYAFLPLLPLCISFFSRTGNAFHKEGCISFEMWKKREAQVLFFPAFYGRHVTIQELRRLFVS
ncbi:uncharacterized protein LOC21409492 [Morus notabilis]|uniref:uncharacterized protein LOC21409492 n=1 Tax=Morus notabilis TaxID=981085 RepID=UPI000CED2898|nr:uncharacterized protein LOC21409492 [Morus notabilis]